MWLPLVEWVQDRGGSHSLGRMGGAQCGWTIGCGCMLQRRMDVVKCGSAAWTTHVAVGGSMASLAVCNAIDSLSALERVWSNCSCLHNWIIFSHGERFGWLLSLMCLYGLHLVRGVMFIYGRCIWFSLDYSVVLVLS